MITISWLGILILVGIPFLLGLLSGYGAGYSDGENAGVELGILSERNKVRRYVD